MIYDNRSLEMSWMPSADPTLGDKRSCDALELVVVPRVRDLGDGFTVRRAMPNNGIAAGAGINQVGAVRAYEK
jgi:hypothetical protein